jgi:hypothetical protein
MTVPPPSPPIPPPSGGLSTDFNGWNALRTVSYTRKFVSKLTGHPRFPEPWPAPVSSLDQLTEKSNQLESADHDAGTRDKLKVAKRNTLNAELKNDLKTAIKYVDMAAQGDTALLWSLDLNMRSVPVRKKALTPVGQAILAVTHGKSGAFGCKVAKRGSALYTELYTAEGVPTDETQWAKYGDFTTQAFEVSGRVPGKSYSLRARLVGRAGPGPWSPVVTLISL